MGTFIAVEGIDGCGKTSLSKALNAALDGVWTCFPERSTFYGKLIDAWLKGEWHARYEASLSLVAREDAILDAAVFQALQTVNRLEVAKHLEHLQRDSRHTIVCDRYWPSGYAYGSADGLDPELLVKLHASLPQPDVFILVDCPVGVAADRVKARGGDKAEVYERRGLAYFERVQAAFNELWSLRSVVEPRRWFRVENTGSFEDVLAKMKQVVVGRPK